MLNPGAWDWRNFAGFFWVRPTRSLPLRFTNIIQAGLCFLCIVYTYFRVPEPQGRSFAELDILFERGVSARNFSSTSVDVFAENVDSEILHKYEEKSDTEAAGKVIFR
jgi:SP family general alpha glucoside:H+ symporter-like MFS transporter